jgi:hypothetical protein
MAGYPIFDWSALTRVLYQLSGLYPLTTTSTRFSKTTFVALIINITVVVVCHWQVLVGQGGKGMKLAAKNNIIIPYGEQFSHNLGPPIFASIFLTNILHRKLFLRIAENIWRVSINYKVIGVDCAGHEGFKGFLILLAILLANFALFAKCCVTIYRQEFGESPAICNMFLFYANNYYVSLTSVHFMMAVYFMKNCFDCLASVLKKM